MSATTTRILLATGGGTYNRGVAMGVRQFARPGHDWHLRIAQTSMQWVEAMRAWRPEGIIIHTNSAEIIAALALAELGVPMVEVGGSIEDMQRIRVCPDDAAVGRLAARHLLDRGLRRFAFLGNQEPYSRRRCQAFVAAVKDAGCGCDTFLASDLGPLWTSSWTEVDSRLALWVQGLPRPCGVFCAKDDIANSLAEVMHALALRIPEDVALLGVDDDEVACLLPEPPLSSIALPVVRIGYVAAEALARLMAGQQVPTATLLPPVRVVERRSTATMAVTDEVVSAALGVIDQDGARLEGIEALVLRVGVPRRTLERRFRAILGISPLMALHANHVDRARRLLAETSLPLTDIARRSGFASLDRFQVLFRRRVGATPSRWRQQAQGKLTLGVCRR